jgi:two-component system, NarL family, nitrate/nitrite response regulator NarL
MAFHDKIDVASPEAFRILVVDDHRLVREMIGDAMETIFPKASVDTARDLEATLEFLSRRPDTEVILLDYRMPDMRGPQSIRKILRAAPKTRIVILSGFINDHDLEMLREARVAAAVTKDLPMAQIADVIRGVLIGTPRFEAPSDDGKFKSFADRFSLTPRESQALRGLVQGLRNAQIADAMGVSEATAKGYLHSSFKKLNVNNRVQAYEIWRSETGQ